MVLKAQDNFEITTMRIGPIHLKMNVDEAEKIAGKKLKIDNDFQNVNQINYNGEIISVYIFESLENNVRLRHIGHISTKSPKFKTKSLMGVGNTRSELIETYKNFPDFAVTHGWTDDGKVSKTDSYFTLTDNDSGTILSFEMKNNVVTSVTVYFNEGC